jgi:hypothetical protein
MWGTASPTTTTSAGSVLVVVARRPSGTTTATISADPWLPTEPLVCSNVTLVPETWWVPDAPALVGTREARARMARKAFRRIPRSRRPRKRVHQQPKLRALR